MAYCTQHGSLLQVASSVKISLGFLQMICDPGQAPVYFISQKQASWSIKLSVCMCVCVYYTHPQWQFLHVPLKENQNWKAHREQA